MERILILGARRGLGFEILKQWRAGRPEDDILATSRQAFAVPGVRTFVCDLTRDEHLQNLFETINDWQPHRIFYVAGGGPHGDFADKEWKDHQWALQLSLLSPARLLHRALHKPTALKQFVGVGSAIAEKSPDPQAASYAAAKHGLRGLISSLRLEQTSVDLRLFSPGYMDTEMLPRHAKPRDSGKTLLSAQAAAESFVNGVLDPNGPWHWPLEKVSPH